VGSAAGDVNGDGYADVLVLGGQSAYLFLGSAAGLASSSPVWSATVQQDYSNPGDVGTAGDVNGDGYGDFVVGAPTYKQNERVVGGRAFAYYGPFSTLYLS
jgi:hypothetical protein